MVWAGVAGSGIVSQLGSTMVNHWSMPLIACLTWASTRERAAARMKGCKLPKNGDSRRGSFPGCNHQRFIEQAASTTKAGYDIVLLRGMQASASAPKLPDSPF